jgi:hypothetical protein
MDTVKYSDLAKDFFAYKTNDRRKLKPNRSKKPLEMIVGPPPPPPGPPPPPSAALAVETPRDDSTTLSTDKGSSADTVDIPTPMDFSRRKLKVLKEKEYNHQPKRLNTRLLEASGVSDGRFAPNISGNTSSVPPIDFSVPPPAALAAKPELPRLGDEQWFPQLEDEQWKRFQEEAAMKRAREEIERQQAQQEAYDIAQRLKEMEEYKKEQEEQQRQREAQELFKAEEERKREALLDEQRQIMRQETEDPEEIAREQDRIREMMDRQQQEDEIIDHLG